MILVHYNTKHRYCQPNLCPKSGVSVMSNVITETPLLKLFFSNRQQDTASIAKCAAKSNVISKSPLHTGIARQQIYYASSKPYLAKKYIGTADQPWHRLPAFPKSSPAASVSQKVWAPAESILLHIL